MKMPPVRPVADTFNYNRMLQSFAKPLSFLIYLKGPDKFLSELTEGHLADKVAGKHNFYPSCGILSSDNTPV